MNVPSRHLSLGGRCEMSLWSQHVCLVPLLTVSPPANPTPTDRGALSMGARPLPELRGGGPARVRFPRRTPVLLLVGDHRPGRIHVQRQVDHFRERQDRTQVQARCRGAL